MSVALPHLIWAKTSPDDDGWLNLPQHLNDAADVAELLWDRWLAPAVKDLIARSVGGADAARALAVFLAGVHDVAKATPAFESVGPTHLLDRLHDAGLSVHPAIRHRRSHLPHGLAGQVAVEGWLVEQHDWNRLQARSIGCVIGGHHGTVPTAGQLQRIDPELLGDATWAAVRQTLMDDMARRSRATHHLERWSRSTVNASIQAVLSGFVIMADWIASNADLFAYDVDHRSVSARASPAWEHLMLPPGWTSSTFEGTADQLLGQRFDLPDTARARPVQRELLELVTDVDEPGLFVVEAAMGEGKTEAALMAAESLCARLGLNGVFFALPSMTTSDAIFTRLRRWVDLLPGLGPEHVSIHLAHSKAGLNDEFRSLARGRVTGVANDGEPLSEGAAIAHAWLSGRKKGLLADFVVGTIDQVLMAALRGKHVVLRHLALAGKVVVIDEVHAADEYMAVFLDRALEWLGAHRVPVILLSATLPGARRAAMARAYDRGRGTFRPAVARRGGSGPTPYTPVQSERGYPLLTATTSASPAMRQVSAGSRTSILDIERLDDGLTTLSALLREALRNGGCAVVIRNTVVRAQQTWEHLRESFGDDVSLMHSRFIATDRLVRDQAAVRRFGPAGPGADRPDRHVVVATQVVEQSLDVDFDLMVSDVAPVDLLLQRSGRLHRHTRDRPIGLERPRLILTGVDWSSTPPSPDDGSTAIYGLDSLLRSMAVLDRPHVVLPDDVPTLVQDAYAEDPLVPSGWEEASEQAGTQARERVAQRQRRAGDHLIPPPTEPDLTGWHDAGAVDRKSEARGRAAVRDGRESLEVVVLTRDGEGLLHRWAAEPTESSLSTEQAPDPETARLTSAATLTLPPALTQPWQIDRTIAALEQNYFTAWQTSPWLREQLIVVLDEKSQCSIGPFVLHYDKTRGLSVTTTDEKSLP
ncbi:CRISPR-associated helicase Cas3' [Aeromicrobium sp. CTD01-1L150]|uniref:CRISPR-associated helicase Cas3' n=1 Tax=Aeromicrobium sp. CTD01-1L150 TaxID=3341830 RepID=UPI0035C2438F